jgi:hypothetical protein
MVPILFGALLLGIAAPARAQVVAPRSKGNFFVYDTVDCSGGGNSSTVTVPFSIGGVNYPPNQPLNVFATDMATNERFGPFVMTTDATGDFCGRVDQARVTQWKIDIEQPGSGFTDSKVIKVVASSPPSTTTAPPTTAPSTSVQPSTTIQPSTTTTTAASSTTTTTSSGTSTTTTTGPNPSSTTTTGSSSTTTATTAASTTTTTAAVSTTTTAPAAVEAAFVLVQIPATLSSTLPFTGSSITPRLAGLAVALIAIGTIACLAARRRQSM